MRVPLLLCSYCIVVSLGLASLGGTQLLHAWTDQSLVSLKGATALETPVELNFDDVPLQSAVETLCRKANLDVVWDEASFAEGGLAPDETVALSTTQPLALRRALALILEPCYLTYELQGDRQLRILSQQQWDGQIVTITYDVRALIAAQPADFDLPELIEQTISPGDWQTGTTTVAGYMLLVDGELQVTQRRSVQHEIAALLSQLNPADSAE